MSNWPTNGNLTGKLSIGQGERGKSLEYMWRGTELGIRQEGEEEYQFVNLVSGADGREIELQVNNGYIQWRYAGEESWNNLIELSALEGKQGPKGEKGEQGLPGKDGTNGQDGANGKNGVTPNISIGTVTTLEAGEEATVTREGTNENPIFNFGIPKGESGANSSGSNSIAIDDSTISTDKTWSSSKIEDFIHTNDDVIWSTVQGENLSVDYTKEGYLREVEIWGNTWQDQDNLSDIKHLGTYNEEKQGYEVEIDSCNAKVSTLTLRNNERSNKVKLPGHGYVKFMTNSSKAITCRIFTYNNDGNLGLRGNQFTIPVNECTKPFAFYAPADAFEIQCIDNEQTIELIATLDTKINSYKDYKSHKTTILLPCQLMKVEDVSDRLYWDSSKDRYVVEKNIGDILLDGSQKCINFVKGEKESTLQYYVSTLTSKYITTLDNIYRTDATRIKLTFTNSELETVNIAGCNKYLKNKPARLIYQQSPQSIQTNITEQALLLCYKDKTHLSVTGGIDGSIKAKAPIDGGKAIQSLSAKNTALAIENEEIKAINIMQDELINTTMLATDEMYMMLEPLLANMLVDGEAISPLVNMYVAMIKRGLKTIDQVPEKYREQVEAIINESH